MVWTLDIHGVIWGREIIMFGVIMKAGYQVGCGKIGAGIVTHYRVHSINSLIRFHDSLNRP